jgi:hypothetical protein
MTDPDEKLTLADPDDLAAALAFALKFEGRKRQHDADAFIWMTSSLVGNLAHFRDSHKREALSGLSRSGPCRTGGIEVEERTSGPPRSS